MKAIVVLFLSVLTLYGAPSFEEIFEKHTMAMLLIDPQSAEIVDANKAAIEFYGYEKKELLAKKITQINLFTSQQIQEEMQRAKQEKRNYFLFRHKLANGEIKRVEVRSVAFDFQGRALLLSFVQDISHERFQQGDIWHYQKTLEEMLEQKTQLMVVVFFVALLFLTLLFLLYRAKKKALENRLVLSQKHFLENIVEGIHHAIIVTDTKGHIIRCNQKTYEMLGYSQEELLGKTPAIFHDKEQMRQRAQELSKSLGREVPVDIELFVLQAQKSNESVEEWNYITKNKEHLEVELSVSPLKNMDGAIEGYIGVATDISQTKANLEELESFFTVNLDLLCIATLDGIFVKTNEAWSDVLGYQREEIEGRNFLDFIHPDDLEKTLDAIAHLSEGKDVSEFTNRYRCHDGSYRYIEWRSHPKGEYIYAAARDITQRQEAENRLIEAQKELERNTHLLNDGEALAKIGGWEYEVASAKMYWTKGLFALHEFSPSDDFDHITQSMQCYLPQDREKIQKAFEACVSQAKPYDLIFAFETYTKKKKWIRTKTAPILENAKVSKVVGIVMDITEHKESEDALKKANAEAQEAVKAKSQFLANMSHEIRTPMNAIIGFGSLLAEMGLAKKQKELLLKMNNSSKILLRILNDILDYSKIEAKKLELEQECFRLVDVMSQLEMIFEASAQQKGLALHFDLDAKLPAQLLGDEHRLEQVLLNLVSNAIKFTQKGEVVVSAKLLQDKEKPFCLMRWSVQDSGIGMDKAQLAKLFEPFTQADSSTTRKYGGTGLGLVISQSILEAMDTKLEVQSKPNEGSCFSFDMKMPLCEENSQCVDEALKVQTRKKLDDERSLTGLKILLVEDNELNQEVATIMLENAGMQVDIASNGIEGVALYRKNKGRYAAILMDLQMPIMSGYEATQEIRREDKNIPIIALTAAAMVEDKQKVLEAGMNDHLGKPIEKEELYRVLLEHVDVSKVKQNLLLDLEPIKEKLRQGALLEQSVLEELYEKLQARISKEALESFKEAIADFEYDAALAQIQKWKI